eukprot:GHVP01013106.1.p1 GENE.GHVP01013106.1~~GHVP01013106.1.p1  ORF type:complete len:583 (+),score=114.67 GHVP01013106.1:1656-3404(+)
MLEAFEKGLRQNQKKLKIQSVLKCDFFLVIKRAIAQNWENMPINESPVAIEEYERVAEFDEFGSEINDSTCQDKQVGCFPIERQPSLVVKNVGELEPLNSLRGVTEVSEQLQRAMLDLERDNGSDQTVSYSDRAVDVEVLLESKNRFRKHVEVLVQLISDQERQKARTQKEHFQMEEILRKTVADQDSKLEQEIRKARNEEQSKSNARIDAIEETRQAAVEETKRLREEVNRVNNENKNTTKQCEFLRSYLVNAGIQIESAMSALREQKKAFLKRSEEGTPTEPSESKEFEERMNEENSTKKLFLDNTKVNRKKSAQKVIPQNSYNFPPSRELQINQIHRALQLVAETVVSAVDLPVPTSDSSRNNETAALPNLLNCDPPEDLHRNMRRANDLVEDSKELHSADIQLSLSDYTSSRFYRNFSNSRSRKGLSPAPQFVKKLPPSPSTQSSSLNGKSQIPPPLPRLPNVRRDSLQRSRETQSATQQPLQHRRATSAAGQSPVQRGMQFAKLRPRPIPPQRRAESPIPPPAPLQKPPMRFASPVLVGRHPHRQAFPTIAHNKTKGFSQSRVPTGFIPVVQTYGQY